MENFWRRDICPLDLMNREPIIFIARDGRLHIALENTRYDSCYNCPTCLEGVNYDDYELDDVVAWCYLEDLRRIPLPDGVKACDMIELQYKRKGVPTSRLFEDKDDAEWFKRDTQYHPYFEYDTESASECNDAKENP